MKNNTEHRHLQLLDFDQQGFLDSYILAGLAEDVRDGDHTSNACIDEHSTDKAKLLCKDHGILAGVEVAKAIFKHVDSAAKLDVHLKDGSLIEPGKIAFHVHGKSRALLKAERLVLNTMQRMSGIATISKTFKDEVADLPVKVLDTRKTTPLLRYLEKWAVQIGGCENYRFGLFDWIMIKDNHVDACGGITQAIQRVHKYLKQNELTLNITVEVRNFAELNEAIKVGGVRRIMLDNFEVKDLYRAVELIHKHFETEASGGIRLNNLRDVALSGVDYISVGALTHSAKSLDLSLKII